MPVKRLTFKDHKQSWSNCNLCSLCETRQHVVLLRGQVPCKILFVGEAPGESEDVIGRPFVGPAGKLLDQQILEAIGRARYQPAYALTNLVGCLPITDGEKREPTNKEILKCHLRVIEVIELCKPHYVVPVGTLAEKSLKRYLPREILLGEPLVHPAYTLRAQEPQRSMSHQQNVVRLTDLFKSLAPVQS